MLRRNNVENLANNVESVVGNVVWGQVGAMSDASSSAYLRPETAQVCMLAFMDAMMLV